MIVPKIPPQGDVIYLMTASPRKTPKFPEFPNPARRPEGSLPPLVINIVSEVSNGTDLALGRIPQRNSANFVNAIRAAGDRSIQVKIDCAGGDGDGALQIATALLQHEFAVHCRIVGRCSSGATFIALAADTRSIIDSGSVLVHAACRLCTPTQYEAVRRLAAKDKQEIYDSLNDLDDAQVSLLETRLGVSEATARKWLNEDRKWTAAEALERGFVDSITADMEMGVVNAETGANYAVEFTAVAILKCAIGEPSSEWATFDGVAANTVLSNGDLTATHNNSSTGGARTASIKTTGKFYYEMTVNNLNGANSGLEFLRSTTSYAGDFLLFETLVIVGTTFPGQIIANSGFTFADIGPITGLTTIGVAVDLDHAESWWRKLPSGDWNGDPTADPATTTGGIVITGALTGGVGAGPTCLFFGDNTETCTANFGASAFVGAVPSGFTPGWTR